MKIIKINESQKNRLFEGYREGFSFEELYVLGNDSFGDYNCGKIQEKYCTKWLGNPFSSGSSRLVYTLNDSLVLKLANSDNYNAGKEQNKNEWNAYQKINSPILPKILYHDDNFSFLVTESVLPAVLEDFEKYVGIPFTRYYTQTSKKSTLGNGGDVKVGYNKYFENPKKHSERYFGNTILDLIDYMIRHKYGFTNVKMEKDIKENDWLMMLNSLIQETDAIDLKLVSNYGIVNRDGKPMIVVLDTGLNLGTYRNYYKRKI